MFVLFFNREARYPHCSPLQLNCTGPVSSVLSKHVLLHHRSRRLSTLALSSQTGRWLLCRCQLASPTPRCSSAGISHCGAGRSVALLALSVSLFVRPSFLLVSPPSPPPFLEVPWTKKMRSPPLRSQSYQRFPLLRLEQVGT